MIESKAYYPLPKGVSTEQNSEADMIEEWLREPFVDKPYKVALHPRNASKIYKHDPRLRDRLGVGKADLKNRWNRDLPTAIAQYEPTYRSYFYRDKFSNVSEKIHTSLHENGHGLLDQINPLIQEGKPEDGQLLLDVNTNDKQAFAHALETINPTTEHLFLRLSAEGLCEWLATEVGERYTITDVRGGRSPHQLVYDYKRGLSRFKEYNAREIIMSGIATNNAGLLYAISHKNISGMIDGLHRQGLTRQEAFLTVAKNPPRTFAQITSPSEYASLINTA